MNEMNIDIVKTESGEHLTDEDICYRYTHGWRLTCVYPTRFTKISENTLVTAKLTYVFERIKNSESSNS